MKIINVFILILCIKSNIDCAKYFKFLSIETCTNKSQIVIIEKCEIEDVSLTIIANLKTPITKMLVTMAVHFLQDSKIIQSLYMKKLDWCETFKHGKVPPNILWKILMSGFGKYLRSYTKCPIKKKVIFDKINADSKMMQFVPIVKVRFDFIFDNSGENGHRDTINVSFTGEVID